MKRHGKPVRVLTGVVDVTRSGKGFLIMAEGDDIPIPRELLGSALSGDIVEVEVGEARGKRVGTVRTIVERKRNSFVGTLRKMDGSLYLEPDDPRVYFDFAIVGGVGAPPGQKVQVDVVRWDASPVQVQIRRALGVAGAHETEMRAILAARDFDADFPADVVREAEALATRTAITPDGRRDFRDVLSMTIDPSDAKDHDDAVSYRKLSDGRVEVGVHIADVSHYVLPGTALDREALKRGTSVYLVDRTIPMLPNLLSEDLCSLLPAQDRLAYSAVFTLRGTEVTEQWLGRSIIRVDHRLSYEDADEILNNAEHALSDALSALDTFARHLRTKRTAAGALIFDRDELKPVLNEKKEAVTFRRLSATPARQLIEELMLLANRSVASLVRKAIGKNRMFLYRIHDVPNVEKLEELAVFLRAVGYQLAVGARGVPQREINRMLLSLKGTPIENMIKVATIRTMAKAVYSTKNIGHFGLSFKDYTHFTSPIRRYPDILVHRVLTQVLSGTIAPGAAGAAEEIAVHASEREADAAEAERASVRLKQVEFMARHTREDRRGVISGVTEWGLYVEDEESGAEGLVHVSTLPGFDHAPKKFAFVNSRTKEMLRLGDPVTFKTMSVNLEERTIDLEILLGENQSTSSR